jgi:uncharacterized integral membrane protein (TIGR00697 family)
LQVKQHVCYLILGVFFVTNALLAELIGVKIFALEDSFGWKPFNWNLFGEKGSLNFTVGVVLWPFVFIMTDIINEYFGVKGVRQIKLFGYHFYYICIRNYLPIAIELAPAGFWPASNVDKGVPDMQNAYAVIFGQGMWIIAGSIVAFLLGQLIDVFIFHKIKGITGEGKIWLRATGSTAISQIIDSVVVLYMSHLY